MGDKLSITQGQILHFYDMAISKHSSRDVARRMCGICLLDHKQSHWTQVHRQKISKIFKNHIQDCKTKKRHKKAEEDTLQDR